MPDSRIPGLRRAEEKRRRLKRERLRAERERTDERLRAERDEAANQQKVEAQNKADAIERDNALSDVVSRLMGFFSGAFIATGFIAPVFAPRLIAGTPSTNEPQDTNIMDRLQNGDVWISLAIGALCAVIAVAATRLKKGKPNG